MSKTEGEVLDVLLPKCLKQDRGAQRELYRLFYGYAMSVCVRYSQDAEEAKDVLNDGFLKVFTRLDQYHPPKPFKGWLRRIMINTALDNYRHNLKNYHLQDIDQAAPATDPFDVEQQLNYEYLIALVQQLSPAYRTVFNLYAIDGYTHEEIAETLGIAVGTSKSNLAKARANLREALQRSKIDEHKQYV
ncbi:RNA polymerase sigma factor [Pontibacter indicus]|uniref:RNA polymerase sigma-70 factor, ECF subfamily n=1 Tax=Pontibacter indicus TaxID=1317125 RepID=A0A1R3XNW1_9BACT|nr:sigma-70 family RNA polymerase sigma factor [Pontibacter indicus]SIT93548.1 RNA polymerase sigma-70 factor, ECF subfamily [Pontibacter indicus]